MPNDCDNYLTVTTNSENVIPEILQEIQHEFAQVTVRRQHALGLRVKYTTPWEPKIQFLEMLVDKYPSIWIKNDWVSEDGTAGICVGKQNDLKRFDWEELCIEAEHFHFWQEVCIEAEHFHFPNNVT